MNTQRPKLILALSAIVLGSWASQSPALTIAHGGKPQTVIVVAADATESERHAAAELSSFLARITGAKFETAERATAKNFGHLLVGPGAAKQTLPEFTTDGLGSDGIAIRTVGSDLILAGGRPRGTLYAVYTFLEDQLDCRWWSSKVSTIPKKPTIVIDRLNIRYVPVLEYREPFWFDRRQAHLSGLCPHVQLANPPADVLQRPPRMVQPAQRQKNGRPLSIMPHK